MKHKYKCKISLERLTVFHSCSYSKMENICIQLHFACVLMTEIHMSCLRQICYCVTIYHQPLCTYTVVVFL